MKINNKLLKDLFQISFDKNIESFKLGLLNSSESHTLSYIDDEKYIELLGSNLNVEGVFITKELKGQINRKKLFFITYDDPRYVFFTLYNFLGKKNYKKEKSYIHKTAKIHPDAYVSQYNVKIDKNVIIEPHVTILPDVIVGENSIIRAGSVIGCEGFEYKKTSKGILPVFHDGNVTIGKNVEIGVNSAICKGFSFRQTVIGDETKIDNLVHISHGVQIGKRCLIIASVVIAGSVTLEDDVCIGPNATISNLVVIEKNAFITLGAVVTKNVDKNERVSGNFAIPHQKFIQNLKKEVSE